MNEDFRICRFDKYNFTVDRRITPKKKNSRGKPWRIIGYYPTLDIAAQRLFDHILLTGKTGLSSIQELIEEIARARERVVTAVSMQLTAGTVAANPGGGGNIVADKRGAQQ